MPSPTASSCATKHEAATEYGWAAPGEQAAGMRRGSLDQPAEDEPQGTSFFMTMSRAQSTRDYWQLPSGVGGVWDPAQQPSMLRAQSVTQPQQLPPHLGGGWDPMPPQMHLPQQQSPADSSFEEPGQVPRQPGQHLQGASSYQSGAEAATAVMEGDDGELGIEAGQELTSRMLDELMGDSELQDMLGFADLSMQVGTVGCGEKAAVSC